MRNVLINVHRQCIGLDIERIAGKRYLGVLLKHLYYVARTGSTGYLDGHKRRARMILLVVILMGVAGASGISWGVMRMLTRLRGWYLHSWKNRGRRPSMRRTRSQTRLVDGGRIIYVPEDSIDGKPTSSKKNKKFLIPPTDNDIYEHDKFLFKNVESERTRSSQLFYSKFLNQMSVISRILIPSFLDKNAILLSSQIFFLIMRTWLSLFVARLDGQIVKDIIAGRGRRFLLDIGCWFLIAIPASYTNSAIKYLQRKLSLSFRTNLTRYIHDMYLDKRLGFYKLLYDSKASTSVIKNIDNSITSDVTKFSDATCSVFANIAKPVIDLVFFSVYLRDNLGTMGVAGIFVNYFITGYILKKYTPPLGELASSKSSAEGDYYNYQLNMINNNEEIAFYQGTEVEKTKVKELYENLMERTLLVDKRKFTYNMVEDYILKYTWSGLGYVFASIPIVVSTVASGINNEEVNMKEFIVNKRLMLSLADAGSRLMHSIKDISQLTGYTNRIFTLLCVLHRVHSTDFNYGANIEDKLQEISDALSSSSTLPNKTKVDIIRGTIQRNFNGVRFENIDVIIPSPSGREGVKLINKLAFQIPPHIDFNMSHSNSILDITGSKDVNLPFLQGPGSSLLILGPNSCGKTSIQRIIAEIWPIYNKKGLMSIPAQENLICIPQKPYFTRGGTLRDQLIYPMSSDEFFDRGFKDKYLVQIMSEVKLDYLLKRGTGLSYLDTVADWKDVLSGGEKQRVNFARIMFHRPLFVVLDEATNAISADMEDYLFNLLKRYRFNFITISQRPTLIKYHDLLLEISGKSSGSWHLQTLGTDEAINSIEHEIEELEEKLENVKLWEIERDELIRKLSVV